MKGLLGGIATGAVVAGGVAVGALTLVPMVQIGPVPDVAEMPRGNGAAIVADSPKVITTDRIATQTKASDAANASTQDDATIETGTDTAEMDGMSTESTSVENSTAMRQEASVSDNPQTSADEVAPPETSEPASPEAVQRPAPPQPEPFELTMLSQSSSAPQTPSVSATPLDTLGDTSAPRRPSAPAREGESDPPRLSGAPERAPPPIDPTQPERMAAPDAMEPPAKVALGTVPRAANGVATDPTTPEIARNVPNDWMIFAQDAPPPSRAWLRVATVQQSAANSKPRPPRARKKPTVASATPEAPSAPDRLVAPEGLSDAPERVAPKPRQLVQVAENSPSVRRLPQIGDPVSEADADLDPADDEAAQPPEQPASAPADALTRNAMPHDAADTLPRLAIILLDDPQAPVVDVPSLTVAIAADSPQAEARAQVWRDAGQEVALIPALTEGSPQAVAQSLEGSLSAVSSAATLMPGVEGDFPGGKDTARAIISRIAQTGHGLITWPSGFDGTARLAAEAGVPTAPVLRRIDGDGRDARAVRRFLDGAAFDASRRGDLIIVAGNTAESRAALDSWVDGRRARGVALVPVSALLRDD